MAAAARWGRLLAVLAAGGAAVVTSLGVSGWDWALAMSALVTGVIASVCGAILLIVASSVPSRGLYRVLLGAAMVVWGGGQLVQAATALVVEPRFPLPGDIVSLAAAPLALAGILAIPRRNGGDQALARLGLDSALLGVTVAFVAWRLWFHEPFLSGDFTATQASAAAILLVDVTLMALGLLLWLRDLDAALSYFALGTALYATGDLITLYAAIHLGLTWPWQGAVLWCIAWPLACYGLLAYEAGRPVDRPRPDPDATVVVVTTTVALLLLLLGLGSLIIAADPDVVSLYFVALAVLVVAARELLNARLRARLVAHLDAEATTDALTGLANLRVLSEQLRSVPKGELWCLLRVDLDGFKEVNDTFGHEVGDALLRQVARLIAHAAPAQAVVARTGGDEFCLLVPGCLESAAALAGELLRVVRSASVDVGGHPVHATASIGVASAGVDDAVPGATLGAGEPLEPLSAAGAALQRAQVQGREHVVTYGADLARERRRRLDVEDRLRRAMASGGLFVAFQPLVCLQDGVVVGAEALARWRDQELGDVGPSEFIPVAEQTGLVIDLGERVLATTLAAAAHAGLASNGLRVSVNVSPLQLRVPHFEDVVLAALCEHGIAPSMLVVEVTESVLIDEAGPALRCLRAMAAAGITIAIDDFGSGYSALGYLSRLPARMLKVDRSLVRSITTSERSRAVVQAIVDMSRSLGLSVVLEGVESAELADLARAMGVDYAQGSWFGTAGSAHDVVVLAEASQLRRRSRRTVSAELHEEQPVVEA